MIVFSEAGRFGIMSGDRGVLVGLDGKSLVARCVLTICVTLALLVMGSGLQGCSFFIPAADEFSFNGRVYRPERIVVPERLIDSSVHTLGEPVVFNPPAPGLDTEIAAGSDIYSLSGYDNGYLALPYEGLYFLYTHSGKERPQLPASGTEWQFPADLNATQVKPCFETFYSCSSYKAAYLNLHIDDLGADDPVQVIRVISDYCDSRGSTLVLATYDELEAKGYVVKEGGSSMSNFEEGLSITLSDMQQVDDTLTLEGSIFAASLAGSGYLYTFKLVDGSWEYQTSEMPWIS
jgi:hypothetical protein